MLPWLTAQIRQEYCMENSICRTHESRRGTRTSLRIKHIRIVEIDKVQY